MTTTKTPPPTSDDSGRRSKHPDRERTGGHGLRSGARLVPTRARRRHGRAAGGRRPARVEHHVRVPESVLPDGTELRESADAGRHPRDARDGTHLRHPARRDRPVGGRHLGSRGRSSSSCSRTRPAPPPLAARAGRRSGLRHRHRGIHRILRRQGRDSIVRRDTGPVPRIPGPHADHRRQRRPLSGADARDQGDHEQQHAGLGRLGHARGDPGRLGGHLVLGPLPAHACREFRIAGSPSSGSSSA